MAITALQVQQIKAAHTAGMLDPAIAQHAGVSLATVKRYRDRLGLSTHCITAQRGRLGEQLVAAEAARMGFSVDWHDNQHDGHDRRSAAAALTSRPPWNSRTAPGASDCRASGAVFSVSSLIRKNYAEDCEVIGLVALYRTRRRPTSTC